MTSQDQTNQSTEVDTSQQQEPIQTDGNQVSDIADLLGLAAEGETPPNGVEQKSGEEPGKQVEEKPPQGSQEQVKPPVAPPQGDDGTPKPKVEEPPKDPDEGKSLKDVLKDVLNEVKAETPKQEVTKTDEPPKPQYSPVVPPELMEAIASDDPATRQAGMNALIGGAMSKVYADVMKEARVMVQQAISSVPQIMAQQQTVQQEREQLRKTFYEENPNFGASPQRMKLVAITAFQYAQELGKDYKGPNQEFRNNLAKRLEEMTGLKAGKVAAPPQGEIKKVPLKQTFQAGGPPARSGDPTPTLSDEIMETIGTLN